MSECIIGWCNGRHGREAQPVSELCIVTSILLSEAKSRCDLPAILRTDDLLWVPHGW